MRGFLLIAALVLMPGLASAQAWSSCPGGGPDGSSPSLSAGETTCYDFTDGTDSALHRFDTFWTLTFDPDIATTGVATSTVYLRGPCVGSTAAAATCEKLNADQTGDFLPNDLPLNGDCGANRCRLHALPPGLYYIDVDTASGGETSRVKAQSER